MLVNACHDDFKKMIDLGGNSRMEERVTQIIVAICLAFSKRPDDISTSLVLTAIGSCGDSPNSPFAFQKLSLKRRLSSILVYSFRGTDNFPQSRTRGELF